jgi:restriction system protein
MTIPPFWVFMRPVLLVLQDGQTRRRKDVNHAAVAMMSLSQEDLDERLKGGDLKAESRAHWAIEYLAQAGAINRPKRGDMVISDIGRSLLVDHPEVIKEADLLHLQGFQDWVERSNQSARARRQAQSEQSSIIDEAGETPLERLIEAVEVLERSTAQQLVERLRSQPPEFLERAVLKLLHAMGYGGSEEDGEHLGKSHDGGLDGVIRQDALGIERVYLQAKRYAKDNTVGSAAIREFVGALTGVGASGGIFITTSGFSSDALKYVERLTPRVILIDGKQLGRLMVDYGVGVTTTQTLRVTEVDENFFDGE